MIYLEWQDLSLRVVWEHFLLQEFAGFFGALLGIVHDIANGKHKRPIEFLHGRIGRLFFSDSWAHHVHSLIYFFEKKRLANVIGNRCGCEFLWKQRHRGSDKKEKKEKRGGVSISIGNAWHGKGGENSAKRQTMTNVGGWGGDQPLFHLLSARVGQWR